jgi:hypothetical protein
LMHSSCAPQKQDGVSPANCWQLSLENLDCAACTALSDSQRAHARHAERAGRLCGAFREAGMVSWCCSLVERPFGTAEVCATCGQLPACPVAVGPAPIIVNVFPFKVPREKAERESTLHKIFIHVHGSHTVDHTANTTRGASLEPLASANAATAPPVPGTGSSALRA